MGNDEFGVGSAIGLGAGILVGGYLVNQLRGITKQKKSKKKKCRYIKPSISA